ncbi:MULTISPECIES: hypothetical protein [unclassified Kitasatospora]|uniref:hypothetical protein n=1 Tax=unclassified Kitasatospora TaxID=2633591 RepID=UPI00070D92EC|nr:MULTISPECIES: hypothetical protein [unclassified Kitasatospora]KQV15683.1 hypothetical protein ASC99_29695 [Kitasatospora sp. Root107]KRB71662.1 hypothetical protein ASE03_24240 [Kitasatospora sp. Root187]
MFGMYWDPLPTARSMIAKGTDPFDGRWAERDWRNVPGPFYAAEIEAGQIAPRDAAEHIAYDDPKVGVFVSWQPVNVPETRALVADVLLGCEGLAMDGDEHWTPDGVRGWWSERGRAREWALETAKNWESVSRTEGDESYLAVARRLRAYADHIDGGLEAYLRGYVFWLAEHRVPERCEALPVLGGRPTGRRSTPRVEQLQVAGYLVVEPEQVRGSQLPEVERLVSAAVCLVDQLPADACWFASPQAALAACASLRVTPAARLLAVLVPADCVAGLAAEIRASEFDDPVLLGNLWRPPALAEGGTRIGWEVLGYELGHLHTWLCSDLHRDAVAELGVRTGPFGLLADRADAEKVADWANARADTDPVTWFPAALVEWDEPVESTFEPITPAGEAPKPWWRRRG